MKRNPLSARTLNTRGPLADPVEPSFDDVDATDKRILERLQRDARVTVTALSEATGLSQTAVRARLEKLKPFIKGHVTLLDCRRMGYREMVIVSLRVNASIPLDRVKRAIEGMDKVKFAYITTGEHPVLVMAKCMDARDTLALIEELRNIDGVDEVKTQMVLDRIKEDPTVIIPE